MYDVEFSSNYSNTITLITRLYSEREAMNEPVSLRDFIHSYPFPAFLLSGTSTRDVDGSGSRGMSLVPLFTNTQFRCLFTGTDTGTDVSISSAFMDALGSVDAGRRLSMWLMPPTNGDEQELFLTLDFNPQWIPHELLPVKLQLVKTRCRDLWAVTTVPLSSLPQIQSTARVDNGPTLEHPAPANMRISDIPTLGDLLDSKAVSLGGGSLQSQQLEGLEPVPPRHEEIERLMITYPWEQTVLGPRESWPDSMKTISMSLNYRTHVLDILLFNL